MSISGKERRKANGEEEDSIDLHESLRRFFFFFYSLSWKVMEQVGSI